MTAEQLREHLKRLDLTVLQFSERIGRHERTVYRWLSGELPIPKWIKTLLENI
jgi:hypothetical protein